MWWGWVEELRPACGRTRTFFWMATCLMGTSTRKDRMGVTSLIRAQGLQPVCYDRLLDFFHSLSLKVSVLTQLWGALVFRIHPSLYWVRGKQVLIGDGLKVAKSGRKMPGVKKLHQTSYSKTKPEYIFGHSCQAVAVLTRVGATCGALPLAGRIHEGLAWSNRNQRTLLDKMIHLLDLLGLHEPFYFLASASREDFTGEPMSSLENCWAYAVSTTAHGICLARMPQRLSRQRWAPKGKTKSSKAS